jgi:nucleoside-diphosphate-sugar epimerase
VVITGSFAAVVDVTTGIRSGYTYTEKDWNPMTKEGAQEAGPTAAYLVSKTLAERAAFEFVETEKPSFSVTFLLPPMVYGPLVHDVSSLKALNTSSADIYRLFNGDEKKVPETGFWAYADVRDCKLNPNFRHLDIPNCF